MKWKWLGVGGLVVAALGCAVLGLLVATDAEGRGGKWALALWGLAIVIAGGAVALALSA